MDETTENFFKVLSEFEWPEIKKPIYRVYHDENGLPILYTMADLPGNYVDISPEDFWLASMDSRVIDGRLVHPAKSSAVKLKPGKIGKPCHPTDVCIVVKETDGHIKWSVR